MVGLKQNIRTSPLPDPADDVLIFDMRAVHVEDQQVGLERVEVGLGGFDQELGGMSADGAVLNDKIYIAVC